MDNGQLKKIKDELIKGTNKAQKSIVLPADVKALLLNAAKLVTELTDREIARNAKSK